MLLEPESKPASPATFSSVAGTLTTRDLSYRPSERRRVIDLFEDRFRDMVRACSAAPGGSDDPW
jgi:hypothetical protein